MNKEKAKLNQIEAIIHADDFYTKYNSEQRSEYLNKRNDLEFKINKENINVRLAGDNKYYYANQCYQFAKHILQNGYPYKNTNDIFFISDISFNKHSIKINNSDIKTFSNKDEMLGFVIGYNTVHNI